MIKGRIGRIHRQRMAGERDSGRRRRRVVIDGVADGGHLQGRGLAIVRIAGVREQVRRERSGALTGGIRQRGRNHGRIVGADDEDGHLGRDLAIMQIVDLNGIGEL